MTDIPDLIAMTATHEEELAADRAVLHVTVQGTSLVTGRAVLQKAKEVRDLVTQLAQYKIVDTDIDLEGMHAEVSTGLLGKNASVTYRLRIRCGDLETLPDVLGVVSSAKQLHLNHIEWKYPESAQQQAGWMARAIADATIKAEAAAAAIGARIVGVRRLSESAVDHAPRFGEMSLGMHDGDVMAARSRAPGASVQLGFEMGAKKRVGVHVHVEYRIEGYAPRKPA